MRGKKKRRDRQVSFGLLNEITSVHSVNECSYRGRDCSCISTNEIIIRTPIKSSLWCWSRKKSSFTMRRVKDYESNADTTSITIATAIIWVVWMIWRFTTNWIPFSAVPKILYLFSLWLARNHHRLYRRFIIIPGVHTLDFKQVI